MNQKCDDIISAIFSISPVLLKISSESVLLVMTKHRRHVVGFVAVISSDKLNEDFAEFTVRLFLVVGNSVGAAPSFNCNFLSEIERK